VAWSIQTANELAVGRLAADCDIHPVLARLLVLRGFGTVDDAGRFLHPLLTDLRSPALMPDMDKALVRIRSAVERKEKLLVWGHDDLDGATSVALLVKSLTELGADVAFYIPDKTQEPHGLNRKRLEQFARGGVRLVITTDCGITNVAEARFARQAGVDVVITDHHELTGGMPEACAIIDPKRPDSGYPFVELSGAGVALKLSMALIGVSGAEVFALRPELLALATLGTIADRVCLVDENRVLVSFGLRVLAESPKPALRALRETIGLPVDQLTVDRIMGEVIPVFTSIDAQQTVQFFLEQDGQRATDFLSRVLSRVSDFKDQGKAGLEILERQAYLSDNLVVAYDPDISIRHLGFCATKLRNRFLMPTLVMTQRGESWVGELRGFDGDDLIVLLKSLGNYLVEYGGHKRACGFSIREDRLESFLHEAQEYARVHFHSSAPRTNPIADGILPLSQLSKDFQDLAPLGPGNAPPLLVSPATRLAASAHDRRLVAEENPALAIATVKPIAQLNGRIDVLYKFDDYLNVTIVDFANSDPAIT
jgi:single-stranded-DNA-specific exonuclease